MKTRCNARASCELAGQDPPRAAARQARRVEEGRGVVAGEVRGRNDRIDRGSFKCDATPA
jgi:hypothetical protein